MIETLSIQTTEHAQLMDITLDVQDIVRKSGVKDGYVIVYAPHTTAGITINENADPDVQHDILQTLETAVPWRQSFYLHNEDNSAAHVKASMMGFSQTVIITAGNLALGAWQGIYFCEFDGPRSRKIYVKIVAG
jgi:secondary thiamine-phosphate synthase enzyme